MTIEEIINIIKNYDIKSCGYCHQGGDEVEEAFNIAIKALEQEPCEDAISRQAVDDAIYDYSRACDVNYAQIMEYIDKLPSVTLQPKMGRWIDVSGGCECSECGCLEAGYSSYCPDCGAKMEGEE